MYVIVIYLALYLCKPDHTMSELTKKSVKDANEISCHWENYMLFGISS